MYGAVHVAHDVDDVFKPYGHGGVVEVLIVFHISIDSSKADTASPLGLFTASV